MTGSHIMTISHIMTASLKENYMALSDRKQREFERREEDILKAALELFSQPNWETVTIEQIAQSADVGKGTVYKHFVSKDEMLFRLMLRFYQGLLRDFQQALRPEDDFLQGFRRIFVYALEYHLRHREYRYVVEYCNRIDFKERADASWHESFRELDASFSAWGDPKIEAAMEHGVIEKRPMKIIQTGLSACFDGAISMLWAGKDWCQHGDEKEVIESVTEFMMSALIGKV